MRRALVYAFVLLQLFSAGSHAQNLNYNDQKSVEIEVNRMAAEQLKKFQPEIDRRTKQLEALQAQILPQDPKAPPPNYAVPPDMSVATPEIVCQKGGCNNELCMPAIKGAPAYGGAINSCDKLAFYDCYKAAACTKTKDSTGQYDTCRWQDTAELRRCLQDKGGSIALLHAGLQ